MQTSTTHQDSLTLLLPASSLSLNLLAWVSPHPSLFTAFLFNAHEQTLLCHKPLWAMPAGLCGHKAPGSTWKCGPGKVCAPEGSIDFQKERCRQLDCPSSLLRLLELVPLILHHGLSALQPNTKPHLSGLSPCSCLPGYLLSTYPLPQFK